MIGLKSVYCWITAGVLGLGCLCGIVSAVVGCLGRPYNVGFLHYIGYGLSDSGNI